LTVVLQRYDTGAEPNRGGAMFAEQSS